MTDESDSRELVYTGDKPDAPMGRWIPAVVVLGVVGGFIALASYAYNSGIQSLKEDDLLIVEADKTPIKEKPLDPGGMQFPNQDKTVFNTFSGAANSPAKVERVLPAPEEPLPKSADNGTSTWINEKLKTETKENDMKAPEQVIASAVEEKKPEEKKEAEVKMPNHQVIAAKPAQEDESETFVAKKTPVKTEEPAKIAAKPVEKAMVSPSVSIVEKPADTKPVMADKTLVEKTSPKEDAKSTAKTETKTAKVEKTASGASYKVQLGAYRSDQEARDAWSKMEKKFPALADKEPAIVRADLGSKGIYFRLRVVGLASPADAKSLCSSLSSKGQACMPVDK